MWGRLRFQRILRDGTKQLDVREDSSRRQPVNMNKSGTFAIVLAVCALVFVPLCAEVFGPASRARWILAWAANQYENGEPQEAADAIAKAASLSSEMATDPEFWRLRFQVLFGKAKPQSEAVVALYNEAMEYLTRVDPLRQSDAATLAAAEFTRRRKHEMALGILKKFYPSMGQRTPIQNNAIAYFRALTDQDLDLALMEVDAAIVANSRFDSQFLDTKAWILHRMGRDDRAIVFAEEAIRLFLDVFKRGNGIQEADRLSLLEILNPSEHAADPELEMAQTKISDADLRREKIDLIQSRFPYLQESDIETLVEMLAVMRFHRACILDELGRTEESNADYAWLDLFGYTNTAELE